MRYRSVIALAIFGLLAAYGPAEATPPLRFADVLGLRAESLARALQAPADSSVARFAKRYKIAPDLAKTILDVATAEGIDPELAFRLVRTESRFKTRARGPQGSLGLVQLMPSTARMLDRSLRSEDQILEPRTNLRLGFRYLRGMIERYQGDVRLGLLAYNRGEVAVDRALRSGRDPENGYSAKVLGSKTDRYSGKGLLQKPKAQE